MVVTGTEELSPGMVRVRFATQDREAFRAGFGPVTFTDRYSKLRFGTAERPVLRTYTILEPDVEAGTMAIDFVVHGDEGYAGPWARLAEPGDVLPVRVPAGAYSPDPTADWHLIAGDDAALPACRAALAALSAEAIGYAVLEVESPAYEQPVSAPDGVEVLWLHRAIEDDLETTVRTLPWRDGRVHAFVHGEAKVVMQGIRPYLLSERAVPREDASISGYWRQGRDEERFREWKRELAAAEETG